MEKQEFFVKIQNALKEYYRTTPCRNCTTSDDDDCINCHKKHIDDQRWNNIKLLKAEYKKQFDTDYDSDYRDLMIKHYREASKKENIINFLNKYTIEDILEVAVELGKTEKLVSIDDVVHWLENNVNNYAFVDETSDTWLKIKSELFDDIRKAMEE